MEYNLSVKDVVFRYLLMMAVVIIGGVLGKLWIMIIGLVFFLTALLGWCPIFQVLGINHAHK